MTMFGTKQAKRRKKSCHAVAMARARGAQRKGLNPVIIALLFIWAFLSAPFRTPRVAVLPARGSASRPNGADQAASDDWPVSDYERGIGGPLKRNVSALGGRYRARPSLVRLMADLRRPAARGDAAAALAIRIADSDVRAWAAERIHKGEINRLSIWVRPGRSDEIVLAAWRGELDAEIGEKKAPSEEAYRVAALLETLAGVGAATTSNAPKI